MNHLFVAIQGFLIGTVALLSFGHAIVPNSSPTPAPKVDSIVRTGEYSYQGYTLKYLVNLPKDGGKVTGKFSGVCSGPIEGNYNAGPAQSVEGQTSVNCPFFQHFKVNYVAHLDLTKGLAYIDWQGNIPYNQGTGSFTFNFTPVN